MGLEDNELLHEIHRELKNLTAKVESAFIKDEEGNPDYAGHRIYHRNKEHEKEDLAKSRHRILSDVTTWLIIGVLTVLGSALVQVYLLPGLHK